MLFKKRFELQNGGEHRFFGQISFYGRSDLRLAAQGQDQLEVSPCHCLRVGILKSKFLLELVQQGMQLIQCTLVQADKKLGINVVEEQPIAGNLLLMGFDAIVVRMKPQRPDEQILRGIKLKHLPRGGKQYRMAFKVTIDKIHAQASFSFEQKYAIQRPWPGSVKFRSFLFFNGAADIFSRSLIHYFVAILFIPSSRLATKNSCVEFPTFL